jgi:hypothetical protein
MKFPQLINWQLLHPVNVILIILIAFFVPVGLAVITAGPPKHPIS